MSGNSYLVGDYINSGMAQDWPQVSRIKNPERERTQYPHSVCGCHSRAADRWVEPTFAYWSYHVSIGQARKKLLHWTGHRGVLDHVHSPMMVQAMDLWQLKKNLAVFTGTQSHVCATTTHDLATTQQHSEKPMFVCLFVCCCCCCCCCCCFYH